MTDEQKRAIWLIARWLIESVPAAAIGQLDDYLASQSVHPNYKIAEELRRALGYPTAE